MTRTRGPCRQRQAHSNFCCGFFPCPRTSRRSFPCRICSGRPTRHRPAQPPQAAEVWRFPWRCTSQRWPWRQRCAYRLRHRQRCRPPRRSRSRLSSRTLGVPNHPIPWPSESERPQPNWPKRRPGTLHPANLGVKRPTGTRGRTAANTHHHSGTHGVRAGCGIAGHRCRPCRAGSGASATSKATARKIPRLGQTASCRIDRRTLSASGKSAHGDGADTSKADGACSRRTPALGLSSRHSEKTRPLQGLLTPSTTETARRRYLDTFHNLW